MKHLSTIELLEDRIAPALIINPFTVAYENENGDATIVKISKPLFKNPSAAGKILVFENTGTGATDTAFNSAQTQEFLSTINLLGRTDAQDMDISVKVVPQVGVGAFTVQVGSIEAATFSQNQVSQNIDLGNITIQGSLGSINAGDNFSTPAIKSLNVQTMLPATSVILGPIVKMNVSGDFNGQMTLIGFQFGTIDSLKIGGSLAGDSSQDSGSGLIEFTGHIGSATIGNITGNAANTGELLGFNGISKIGSLHVLGNITGGSGADSGVVAVDTTIGNVMVDGNIVGGTGQNSGEIAGILNTVTVKGSVIGSTTASTSSFSGAILSRKIDTNSNSVPEPVKSISIGGDVTGGTMAESGYISGTLGNVTIKGNVTGGSAANSGEVISQSGITIGSTVTDVPAGMGTLAIGGNITGGTAASTGLVSVASAGSIFVGGSLIGGGSGDSMSGSIFTNGAKTLTVGGSLTGGAGDNSGSIEAQTTAASSAFGTIMVAGDVAGGAGTNSGSIYINANSAGIVATVGSVKIGGSIIGGTSATRSGEVFAFTSIGSATIGGNITGGAGTNSGVLGTTGTLGPTTVGGNLTGGALASGATVSINDTGLIQGGHIPSLRIGGGITSGVNSTTDPTTTTLTNSGAIRSTAEIGTLTIGGDITGNSVVPVIISAAHGVINTKTPAVDLAINSIAIGSTATPSTVTWLDLLAGYDGSNTAASALGAAVDGSAQINSIALTGTLASSNIVAGVLAGTDKQFGTTDDTAITPKLAANAKSAITSLVISGTATGDGNVADNFGIVAESIAKVTVAGSSNLATALTVGTPAAVSGSNLFLLEVT